MDYLKNYNITEEQINDIEETIVDRGVNIDLFKYCSNKVKEILNLFVSIGVTNIYEIIIANPSMFCDTVDSIRKRINEFGNTSELARLINEDAENLSLVGLM